MANEITRKEFLTNSSKYAVGAVVGIAGLDILAGGKILANEKAATWPFPYVTLDPDEARIKGHYLYWNDKDCCAGAFGGVLEQLKQKLPDPWANIPMEVMLFGRGGGNGWGTICGSINGGAALISLVVDKASSGNLINELWGWYCQAYLPTDKSNEFAVQGKFAVHKYDNKLMPSISGSPLCHASVSQWCIVANKKMSDTERKERCARVTGDAAAKTVELLNAFFAKTFVPTFVTPADAKACQGCHGSTSLNNVMTQMSCSPCHSTVHQQTTKAQQLTEIPTVYKLSQNYPNPFNPSTTIRFSIPQADKVHLAIYNIQGSLVKTLVDHELYNTGSYQVNWNGINETGEKVASGIYFARLQTGKFINTIKMNLVK
ncbi:MAG: C-GCAxxG-C-C family protein [Bacteroidetes bacterium]|nr:C-GCAxxG-C-C family protein [Bacteroidota bacterium]MCL6099000.1 C-GCAxxG-C-C family protein [Bacteroidota bacterium]